MKNTLLVTAFLLCLCHVMAQSGSPSLEVDGLPLFQQAVNAQHARYLYAVNQGARFVLTPDKKSFLIIWYPPGRKAPDMPPVIFTLHGHGSYALDEFYLWHAAAAKRGYGIIALQWWLGKGETAQDYYLPNEIYRTFDQISRIERLLPSRNLLHGFSRGSANCYGVTAFDRHTRKNLFLLTIANAGKAGSDFPVNIEISKGRFGKKPFENSHWVMYAGGKDPHPERDGILGMREAERWVTSLGGTVDAFIGDSDGDHGGFHRNPENMEAALDVFQRLLGSRK